VDLFIDHRNVFLTDRIIKWRETTDVMLRCSPKERM